MVVEAQAQQIDKVDLAEGSCGMIGMAGQEWRSCSGNVRRGRIRGFGDNYGLFAVLVEETHARWGCWREA